MSRISLLAALAVVGGTSAYAQVLLPPGGNVNVPVVAFGPGVVIDQILNDHFVGTNILGEVAFTGFMDHFVIRRPNNTLTFAWRIRNTGGGHADPIVRFTVADYSGFTTWAGQDPALGFGPPVSNVTTADRNATGRVVGFNLFPLASLENSPMVFVDTDATVHTFGSLSLLNGGQARVVTFAPVPEPATMLVLGAGLAALAARRRKK